MKSALMRMSNSGHPESLRVVHLLGCVATIAAFVMVGAIAFGLF